MAVLRAWHGLLMDTKQWYREEGSGECAFLSVTVAGTLALLRRSLHPLAHSDDADQLVRPIPLARSAVRHHTPPTLRGMGATEQLWKEEGGHHLRCHYWFWRAMIISDEHGR
jgi:hypothetical protein